MDARRSPASREDVNEVVTHVALALAAADGPAPRVHTVRVLGPNGCAAGAEPRPVLVTLVTDGAARREIDGAVAGRMRTVHCGDRSGLLGLLRQTETAAAVVDVRDARGRPTAGTVAALIACRRHMPVLAYARPSAADMSALATAVRAGATDVWLAGTAPAALWLLADSSVRDEVGAVRQAVLERHPAWLHPLVHYCIEHAAYRSTADELAATIGLGRRGLAKRMALAGLRPPVEFLTCCRLVLAADRLMCTDQSVERVAHHVGLSCASALHGALRRRTSMTPGEVRLMRDLAGFADRLFSRGAGPSTDVGELPDLARGRTVGGKARVRHSA